MLEYKSIKELVDLAEKKGCTISQLVIEDQARQLEQSPEEIIARMEESFDVMIEAVKAGQDKDQRSTSGLTGGEGYKMLNYSRSGESLSGSFVTGALSRSLAVAGWNASMGRIVAAPTAGSCGILPGCLISLYEEKKMPKRKIVESMFTAGAFGIVIATNASIAGAQGGCQAECGSASAIAAAALIEVMGGTPSQAADAAALAIVSQMGLVCDPVAGLVEIPCIKRNAAGVMIAFSSADMVLAGIPSAIPVDECIDAMREVGDALPASLKETSGGGLATTPTGKALKEKVFGKS